MSVTALIVNL